MRQVVAKLEETLESLAAIHHLGLVLLRLLIQLIVSVTREYERVHANRSGGVRAV
jgi:hypothetical protein